MTTFHFRFVRRGIGPAAGVLVLLCGLTVAPADDAKKADPSADDGRNWKPLFDGKSLKGWEKTIFGGEGEVTVENGAIVLGAGSDLTGIHTKRKLPKTNYEIELEAQRVEGSDFFCGMTFPVKASHCSLILGGWGGGVCGLSSLDGMDASENETTQYREFQKGKWYRIRLRVTDAKIEVWLDGEKLIDQDITGKKISTRIEVDLSKPFGFASWCTTAALRNIRLRELTAAEVKAAAP